MALETPIVATTAGGTTDLMRADEDGLLTPPGDVDMLAAAIRSAIDHPHASRKRAASARQRVERELSFDVRMQKVEALYEQLTRMRDRPVPVSMVGNA